MKKILCLSLIMLILIGCSSKKVLETNKTEENKQEENINSEIIEEEKYVDDNPIKIAFYKGNNGIYKRLDNFQSKVESMKEISVFSIVLSNSEVIEGTSIKNLFNSLREKIPEFNNYKIGYNIKFTLEDGRVIDENIFKPLNYGSYGFSPYIYAWLYDDVNTTGWHSHIEENEFNDDTIMTSIKLMWGPNSNEINSNIELTVFTYDSDDFDEFSNYRGISKYTTIIERS